VRVHDAFVVKYDAAAQRGLPMHCDQSVYSLTLALNPLDAYAGGGTFFESLSTSLRPDVGQVRSRRQAERRGLGRWSDVVSVH
jgi:hypothetical protein